MNVVAFYKYSHQKLIILRDKVPFFFLFLAKNVAVTALAITVGETIFQQISLNHAQVNEQNSK